MLFYVVEPFAEFRNVHRGQLGNILVPDSVRKCLAVQSLTFALRALGLGQKLVGPLLSGSGVVVLHYIPQVLDDAVERYEVVAGSVNQFLVYTNVLQRAVEHLLQGIVRNVGEGCFQVTVIFFENGINLPEYHLVLVFSQGHNAAFVDALIAVGYHLLQVNLVDIAQSLAMWTSALWRVERKVVRCWVTVTDA